MKLRTSIRYVSFQLNIRYKFRGRPRKIIWNNSNEVRMSEYSQTNKSLKYRKKLNAIFTFLLKTFKCYSHVVNQDIVL